MRLLRMAMFLSMAVRAAIAVPAPGSCAAEPALHELDFWIGDWTVADAAGAPAGTNRIERVAGGCALMQTWHDPDGSETRGLFYYMASAKEWRMVLVTAQALSPGGVRERRMIAKESDGSVRFQGEYPGLGGATIVNRMTATPLAGGRVRERIEVSRDGGVTWIPAFEGFYAPAIAPAAPRTPKPR